MTLLSPVAPRASRDRPPPLSRARPPRAVRLRALLWRARFLVAAGCLGLAAAATVQALRPPPPATEPVVVLTRDVPAGTELTPADLTVADLPPEAAPAGAWAQVDGPLGGVAAVDLPAALPVTPSLLVDGSLAAPPGRVVVAVRLADAAVTGLLEPGVHVDLVAAHLDGAAGGTVARRALVLPHPQAAADGAGLLTGPVGADDGPPLLVAVVPEEAVQIAQSSVSARIVAVVVP